MERADITDAWRKSTYSGGANNSCVEVGNGIKVRDTTQAGDPCRTVLSVTSDAWSTFVASIK